MITMKSIALIPADSKGGYQFKIGGMMPMWEDQQEDIMPSLWRYKHNGS